MTIPTPYPAPHIWGDRTDNPDAVTNARLNDAQDNFGARLDIEAALAAQFALDPFTTSGLTFGYRGGNAGTETEPVQVAAGTLELVPGATNLVQLERASGAVTVAATLAAGQMPLHRLVCNGAGIADWTDLRGWCRADAAALKFRGAYEDATAYFANDVVTSAGAHWRAQRSTLGNVPVEGDDWAKIGAGAGGGGGPFNWLGAWANVTAYVEGDEVQNNAPASTYRCSADHTSGDDTEPGQGIDWQMVWAIVAEAGEPGPAGADGVNGMGYGGTSSTSLPIGVGSKTFDLPAGLAYAVGSRVRASSAANGGNYMEGLVSSYAGTSLVLLVGLIGGTGSFADWTFSVAGSPGHDGSGWPEAWQGAWDGATAYALGDVVSSGGSGYVCNAAHSNHEPPNLAFWDVFVLKGLAGTLATDPHHWTALQTLDAVAGGAPTAVVLAGNLDALDHAGKSEIFFDHSSGDYSVEGIKFAPANRFHLLLNNQSHHPITLVDRGTPGSGATGLALTGGVDYVLNTRDSLELVYEVHTDAGPTSSANFWRPLNPIPRAGGGDLLAANNLADLANAATARTNLGLGTAAVLGTSSDQFVLGERIFN